MSLNNFSFPSMISFCSLIRASCFLTLRSVTTSGLAGFRDRAGAGEGWNEGGAGVALVESGSGLAEVGDGRDSRGLETLGTGEGDRGSSLGLG